MIVPRVAQAVPDVAGHYDELDGVYRALWGEHVHHGLWTSGRESVEQATDALADRVGANLALAPGAKLVDIGCGYGATAQRFAERHGVSVTGFSLSRAQVARAERRPGALAFQLCDWLDNGLADGAFDGAYAIESSEHMVDKQRFFDEAYRVLRPGGRLVVCAWLAADAPRRWEVAHLLEPICREGRLPGMGTRGDYTAMAGKAGFDCLGFGDLSRQVRNTWTICARRFAGRWLRDPVYRRLLGRNGARDRAFAWSVPRLILAYRTGAMRYGIFTFQKP